MRKPPSIVAPREIKLLRRVAVFRYELRRFLRFSERAARACGVTPQQHQLLLGVAGFTGRGWATISELAEFLQERHNAVVSLVGRAARRGLIRKAQSLGDRREVRVHPLPKGARLLQELTQLHQRELGRFRLGLTNLGPSSNPISKGAGESRSGRVQPKTQSYRRPRRITPN